jgi:hypothetical protein
MMFFIFNQLIPALCGSIVIIGVFMRMFGNPHREQRPQGAQSYLGKAFPFRISGTTRQGRFWCGSGGKRLVFCAIATAMTSILIAPLFH